MFLFPLLLLAVATFAVYRALHRQVPLAAAGAHELDSRPVQRPPFWPTTVEGKAGIAAFVFSFVPVALVNVIQVAFLGWAVQIAALALTAVGRLARHDRSMSVLLVLLVTALGVLASLLFLAGEILIGHD